MKLFDRVNRVHIARRNRLELETIRGACSKLFGRDFPCAQAGVLAVVKRLENAEAAAFIRGEHLAELEARSRRQQDELEAARDAVGELEARLAVGDSEDALLARDRLVEMCLRLGCGRVGQTPAELAGEALGAVRELAGEVEEAARALSEAAGQRSRLDALMGDWSGRQQPEGVWSTAIAEVGRALYPREKKDRTERDTDPVPAPSVVRNDVQLPGWFGFAMLGAMAHGATQAFREAKVSGCEPVCGNCDHYEPLRGPWSLHCDAGAPVTADGRCKARGYLFVEAEDSASDYLGSGKACEHYRPQSPAELAMGDVERAARRARAAGARVDDVRELVGFVFEQAERAMPTCGDCAKGERKDDTRTVLCHGLPPLVGERPRERFAGTAVERAGMGGRPCAEFEARGPAKEPSPASTCGECYYCARGEAHQPEGAGMCCHHETSRGEVCLDELSCKHFQRGDGSANKLVAELPGMQAYRTEPNAEPSPTPTCGDWEGWGAEERKVEEALLAREPDRGPCWRCAHFGTASSRPPLEGFCHHFGVTKFGIEGCGGCEGAYQPAPAAHLAKLAEQAPVLRGLLEPSPSPTCGGCQHFRPPRNGDRRYTGECLHWGGGVTADNTGAHFETQPNGVRVSKDSCSVFAPSKPSPAPTCGDCVHHSYENEDGRWEGSVRSRASTGRLPNW